MPSKPGFFYPELGALLVKKRKELGLNQTAFLEKVRQIYRFAISPGTYRKYEDGRFSDRYNLRYHDGAVGCMIEYFLEQGVLIPIELEAIGFKNRMIKEIGEDYFYEQG